MADRFPLIYNPSAGQIQELAAGDNLDLTSSGVIITGVTTVSSGSTSAPAITPSGDSNTGIFFPAADTVAIGEGGSEVIRIDANSRVGISTTTPPTKFYVVGNSASNVVAVGTATTITIDMSTGNNFAINLNGNYTLGNPTGITTGQSGVVFLVQDSTGSRTLGFSTHWVFPAGTDPTLTTTANAVDALFFVVRNSTSIVSNSILNVS